MTIPTRTKKLPLPGFSQFLFVHLPNPGDPMALMPPCGQIDCSSIQGFVEVAHTKQNEVNEVA
jgi:hypothetical protein